MIIIETLEGAWIDFSKYGMRPLKLVIDSLIPRYETETIDGRDGHIELETTYEGRTLKAHFMMESIDTVDYSLLRSEIYKLFNAKTQFYILDARVPNKRWKVRTVSRFTPERLNHVVGTFELDLISSSPYSESTGSTLDPFTFESEAWGVGAGLEAEEVDYIHNSNTFSIFNAGDVSVDPREQPLKITFTGASENLTISNTTTGDVWAHTGSTLAEDTFVLDGIKTTKNGISDFKNTNKKVITLAPGWNDFTISGATDFTIQFEFRFYYI